MELAPRKAGPRPTRGIFPVLQELRRLNSLFGRFYSLFRLPREFLYKRLYSLTILQPRTQSGG